MTKEKLQIHYNFILNQLDEFNIFYDKYKNGKNLQIRKEAERKMNSVMTFIKMQITNNPEIYDLFTGGYNDANEKINDLNKPQFFHSDIPNLLKKLLEKITSM